MAVSKSREDERRRAAERAAPSLANALAGVYQRGSTSSGSLDRRLTLTEIAALTADPESAPSKLVIEYRRRLESDPDGAAVFKKERLWGFTYSGVIDGARLKASAIRLSRWACISWISNAKSLRAGRAGVRGGHGAGAPLALLRDVVYQPRLGRQSPAEGSAAFE